MTTPPKTSFWQSIFPGNPEGGIEGSLPFRFENFGTFAGPQFSSTNFDFDKFSVEGTWTDSAPGDYTFKNNDLGMFLFNNELNYVGFHCDGVSTAQMYLQHAAGNIPIFTVMADRTNVLGDINAVGNITATGNIVANGDMIANGNLTQNGAIVLSGLGDVKTAVEAAAKSPAKGFDMHHPTKKGWRLTHICLEGPEAAVYYRGKLKGSNIIELPEYWRGLVDLETVTVNLTPIGAWQELFVEKIQWGTEIHIKNNLAGPVNCHYTVYGERKDVDKIVVEYEGKIEDYPGNDQRSIVGYHYDYREGVNG
tara:strand:+ start:840 stop:1763 length:924 start_codon:yes stop_codon:yes gene_type:complete